MAQEEIKVRNYSPTDYSSVKKLYQAAGWFDPETDAEERLNSKSNRDPQSLLVATNPDNIVGTVSLIEDGRIAIFFRLLTADIANAVPIRTQLLSEGSKIFKQRGYKEVHIIAPEKDIVRQAE